MEMIEDNMENLTLRESSNYDMSLTSYEFLKLTNGFFSHKSSRLDVHVPKEISIHLPF